MALPARTFALQKKFKKNPSLVHTVHTVSRTRDQTIFGVFAAPKQFRSARLFFLNDFFYYYYYFATHYFFTLVHALFPLA